MSHSSLQNESVAEDRRAASRLLMRTARHGESWVGILAATALALAVADTALPAVSGRAVDSVVGLAPRSWIIWTALVVAALVTADALDDLATGGATARSTSWLRRSVLHHFLALGPRAARRFTPGDAAGRLTANAADAGRAGPVLVRGGANVITGLGSAVALALIDPWLCLTFVAGVPVLALVLRAFARRASITAENYLDAQGKIAARLVDAISGARTIGAAGTVEREIARVLAPLPVLQRHGMEMWRQHAKFGSLDALLAPTLGVIVLAVAGAELSRGRITPGEMLAAGEYAMLGTALTSLVSTVRRLAQARAGAGRAAEVLNEDPPPYGDADLPDRRGDIEFRGVSVRAGERLVLDGVDLAIPAGALFAVVGRTGSGKSLLAGLAGRLFDPDEGEVVLDGVALPRLSRDVLRGAVTYAFERPVLFGETLAEVIAFGQQTAPPAKVVAAASTAQADAFIRRTPKGYDTRLAEAPMSGGEVQRISLARAFAHAGSVLILDDVAASLDTVTEHQISLVLSGQLAALTRLVVAHRASTAARADAVVWLEDGRVHAVAPHHLLWREAAYRALFEPDDPSADERQADGWGEVA